MQNKSLDMKTNGKALKIRIVAVIAFLAIISITYFTVAVLVDQGFFVNPVVQELPKYNFETPNFNKNIYEDEEYLSLIADGFINYSDGRTTVSVREEDYEIYSDAARLIFALVTAARDGDQKAYNACFSNNYLTASGKQTKFTMQQIYDVKIVEGLPVRENGYLRTDMELEYKIHENDGTLRKDIDSDSSRKQYITVTTNNPNGVPLIDSITIVNTQIKDQLEPISYNTLNITLTAVIAAVVIIASGALMIVVFVKTKNIRYR